MDSTLQINALDEESPSAVKRFFAVLLLTAAILCGAAYSAGYILIKGPSPFVGAQVVCAMESHPVTRAALRLYLSEEEQTAYLTEAGQQQQQFSVHLREE